jgi:hypothetical protein
MGARPLRINYPAVMKPIAPANESDGP